MSKHAPEAPDLTIVWAVCEGIDHAGQMTRHMLSTSAGWSEVDESHDKVRAALGLPPNPSPVRASSKEE
jgi:hypothetical protein